MKKKLDIFCFPQAGADANCFSAWQPLLLEGANILPVTLPGRGWRIDEAAIPDFQILCDHIFAQLKGQIGHPFALLGSSMGGWMAYEIAYRLEQAGQHPALVILLSSPTPETRTPLPELHDPETAIADILTINPTFAEAAAYPELMEMILPTITTDFRMCNAYLPIPERRIATPVIGLTGDIDDLAPAETMTGWQSYTTGSFELHRISGDHRLHETPSRELLDILTLRLAQITDGCREPGS